MIWDAPEREEYPSVRAFANKMKMTIMDAHDAIMKTRVKQTVGANKKRRECPLVKGDLVYISTKNINLPKGTSRKLVPKFVGPYQILEDFGNNSYRVELPDNPTMIGNSLGDEMTRSWSWVEVVESGPWTGYSGITEVIPMLCLRYSRRLPIISR